MNELIYLYALMLLGHVFFVGVSLLSISLLYYTTYTDMSRKELLKQEFIINRFLFLGVSIGIIVIGLVQVFELDVNLISFMILFLVSVLIYGLTLMLSIFKLIKKDS